MTMKRSEIPEEELVFDSYTHEQEEEWRRSKPRFTDKDWLAIFPDAKTAIADKIAEWTERRADVVATILVKAVEMRVRVADDFSRWFGRELIKINEGVELLNIDRQLARLNRLLSIVHGKPKRGWLTEEQIQEALDVPIEDIAGQHTVLRKRGKHLWGLCPLHAEKHPSFSVCLESNKCWCYGCNQGGDTIQLVRLLHGLSFKEAVHYLTGGDYGR